MTEIENSYEAAKEALENYRREILKEFLKVAKELSVDMEELCETGIDDKRFLCFAECADGCSTVVNRRTIIELKKALNEMNEENALELYQQSVEGGKLAEVSWFDKALELERLSDKCNGVELAKSCLR